MSLPISPEVRDLLTLRLVPGIGPRLTGALLERFGSATEALRAAPAALREVPHIGPKLADELSRAQRNGAVAAELDLIARHGVTLLARGTPDYPPPLADIPDAPWLLYARGRIEPADAKAVAIVGSRKHTAYGRRVAERLATDLAKAGYTIISGLARGIDGIAHRAALQAGGRTIAVLANGLSRIYPPEHADLARQVASAGAVVSEAPMGQGPLAELFPGRNRIISGLARAVVIVEAAQQSGTLITASHAADQGRTVFAVPGPIDSEASAGCHELLRQGAILVRSADDVREELEGVSTTPAPPAATPVPPGLDETQRKLWEFLADGPRHVDEMAQGLALTVPQLSGPLLVLEMKKVLRRLPGNRYERF